MEVIEIIERTKIVGAYNIKVKAKTPENKTFSYVFIKTDKEEADSIVIGYKWEMGCKPKTF